jgi:hypothetical protein
MQANKPKIPFKATENSFSSSMASGVLCGLVSVPLSLTHSTLSMLSLILLCMPQASFPSGYGMCSSIWGSALDLSSCSFCSIPMSSLISLQTTGFFLTLHHLNRGFIFYVLRCFNILGPYTPRQGHPLPRLAHSYSNLLVSMPWYANQ